MVRPVLEVTIITREQMLYLSNFRIKVTWTGLSWRYGERWLVRSIESSRIDH